METSCRGLNFKPIVVDKVIVIEPTAAFVDRATGGRDGYTLLVGANTMLMASQPYKRVPFDPVKDFSPVSMATYDTLMLVANPLSTRTFRAGDR